ncbi:disease resistance protein (TIR-NBS-LRR class) [Artemisia annua]|uniref:Disease resistance protein (TIR-NBS-LRR class) n=1 Tax=Artemisia annua TaxID=35608 RepID=A0A2U1LI17_ARTAN|nr:disease resistance protein (TIR-NBS-LRR class) [Artemisia annua]
MASSSNSSAPKIMASTSTTSIQKRFKYDVFLSFRGEDTRKNIVDHLYHALKDKGIYTYKDDEKIQKGKRISDDLFKSIEDSKFYIIVFSKNYASSSWCLEELVKIMECQKMEEHTAYPVFYDVEPTEIRKQSGAVGEAFAKHAKEEAAGKWREALKEAADLAGWELKNTFDGHEGKFIKEIVGEISLELRSISFGFDEKLVGMETRVKDVVSSLEVGSDEVRMIGIKGMGGAGKTTTARAVFDTLSNDFEAISFVENVREVSKASIFGLKNLQEQVLSKLLNERVTLDSVTDGKNMMKERMRCTKVLLVLDDVDDIEQLEALAGGPNWFKSGSRIIVTTRNEQVLVAHRVEVIRDIALLSKQEAISLFSRYAFGRENPLQGYEELSGKVVRYAAGLPLTLKVLGSFLCGKGKLEWEDAIERLKKIPLQETLEKLELSYMSLEDEYKEIFLDIACLLKRKCISYAITILESCGFHAIIGLKVLAQRSLITFSSRYDGELVLGMHDHIEEMGKNIVRRSREPNKHSRLWKYEEVEDILANDKGTKATRCLKLNMWRRNSRILLKGLGKMKELRYLEVFFANYDSESDLKFDDKSNTIARIVMKGLRKMKILGCLEVFFANHDSESDHYDSESDHYNSESDHYDSESDHYDSESDLKFDDIRQCFTNSLKYLKCTNYPFLYLPKTFQANNLVGLKMKHSRMVQLWEEGERKVEELVLKKLKFLSLSQSKLRTFDLGLTPNLETLSLDRCAQFEELHVLVACPNLKILNLRKSRLRSLDLELIPNLEELDLEYCDQLVEIKAPVGCLRKLVDLNLDGCLRFKDFTFYSRCEPKVNCSSDSLYLDGRSINSCPLHPNSNLPKFEFTCIYEEYLPSSVGNIEKLISFGLCACTDLEKFSDMICSLQCLQKVTLNLHSEEIEHLPDSICMLKHLKYLSLKSCALLEKLPEDIGQLESLQSLDLSFTRIKHLPDSICMLKHLKSLNVNNCSCLGKLPEDIGQLESLESLDLSFTMIKHLPYNICMLKRLKSLDLYTCGLLEKLPEDLGRLECLKELKVRSEKIEYLPDSICMLKCLKSLYIDNDLLENLPENLGQLECLEELRVSSKKIEFLPDSICMLKRLKSLRVGWCCRLEKLPEDIGQLESLERLTLWDTTIKHLPDSICMLKRLKSLELSHCALLEKLPDDIDQLESLESLDLSTTMIKHLPDSICMLKHLEGLTLDYCDLLEKLPVDLGQLECLEELRVSSKKIEFLPDSICKLKHLKGLILLHCDLLEKLPVDLGQLECLERLHVSSKKIEFLPDSICMLKSLKWLIVRDCSCLGKLPEDIGQLESLIHLNLGATKIKHLPDSICMIKHLIYLNLEDCALLEKLPDHLPPRFISASSELRLHSGVNSGSSSGGSNSGSSTSGSRQGVNDPS